MTYAYSILVNTCDQYDDCWYPFFKLLKKYWPECKGKIYLKTQHKNYQFKGLSITSTKVCETNQDVHKVTWSECLIRGLNIIDNDVVLYLQEDYFLKAAVKNDVIEKYVKLMNEDKSIDCIHLTDQAVVAEEKESNYKGLFPVALKQRYRISMQAALWRKEVLLSYLRSNEDAWQFEEFGSIRSGNLKHKFYVIDQNKVKLNKSEIIPYIFTGIEQGRWIKEVVPLFKNNNIDVDYQKRGFVKDAPRRKLASKVKYRLNKIPHIFKSYCDLFLMRLNRK